MTEVVVENSWKTPKKVSECHLMGVTQLDFYPEVPILKQHIFWVNTLNVKLCNLLRNSAVLQVAAPMPCVTPPTPQQTFMLQKVEETSTFCNMKICCTRRRQDRQHQGCNPLHNIAAQQVARFCCPFYFTLKGTITIIIILMMVISDVSH